MRWIDETMENESSMGMERWWLPEASGRGESAQSEPDPQMQSRSTGSLLALRQCPWLLEHIQLLVHPFHLLQDHSTSVANRLIVDDWPQLFHHEVQQIAGGQLSNGLRPFHFKVSPYVVYQLLLVFTRYLQNNHVFASQIQIT